MLVDLVSWFCEPQQRGEALAERPAEEGLEGQEPRGTRRVEDLNRGYPQGLARELGAGCLSRRRYSCAGEASAEAEGKFGDGQTLGTGVVLGEPGFDLGERGRRDRFGSRRGESLFSRESGYTKNSKAVTVVL
jgi:hypothetical protein